MILPILKKGHPLLNEGAKIIVKDEKNPEIKKLISDMKETMIRNNGIGLAANQIGRKERIFVLNYDLPNKQNIFKVFINPEIKDFSKEKSEMEEGCLSVPGVFGLVKRPKKVLIEALNENGQKINYWADDLEARIIQHEVDHLNGILFLDRAKNLYRIDKDVIH